MQMLNEVRIIDFNMNLSEVSEQTLKSQNHDLDKALTFYRGTYLSKFCIHLTSK